MTIAGLTTTSTGFDSDALSFNPAHRNAAKLLSLRSEVLSNFPVDRAATAGWEHNDKALSKSRFDELNRVRILVAQNVATCETGGNYQTFINMAELSFQRFCSMHQKDLSAKGQDQAEIIAEKLNGLHAFLNDRKRSPFKLPKIELAWVSPARSGKAYPTR